MSVQNRRRYDPEFKRNAVRLSEEAGRTIREVAENLGIGSALIYRWRQQERECRACLSWSWQYGTYSRSKTNSRTRKTAQRY